GCVIEPGARVIGVKIAAGHYVPAGAVITTQAQADALPAITADYAYRSLNDGVIHVNTQLAGGYLGKGRVEAGDEAPRSRATEPAPAPAAEGRASQARSEATATPRATVLPTRAATVLPTALRPGGGH